MKGQAPAFNYVLAENSKSLAFICKGVWVALTQAVKEWVWGPFVGMFCSPILVQKSDAWNKSQHSTGVDPDPQNWHFLRKMGQSNLKPEGCTGANPSMYLGVEHEHACQSWWLPGQGHPKAWDFSVRVWWCHKTIKCSKMQGCVCDIDASTGLPMAQCLAPICLRKKKTKIGVTGSFFGSSTKRQSHLLHWHQYLSCYKTNWGRQESTSG